MANFFGYVLAITLTFVLTVLGLTINSWWTEYQDVKAECAGDPNCVVVIETNN